MDFDTGSRLIRAARGLLRWDSERFARGLDVGVATVKRVEAGRAVRDDVLRVMLARLPSIGVAIIEPDPERGIVGGVALMDTARRAGVVPPTERRERKPG